MATIVEYTDKKQPENGYPTHIVSPPRSGPCCFSDSELRKILEVSFQRNVPDL